MLVASGLSPYGGLYRVLSAPACGNRWGPSMDNLLPMCERKLSLPRKARSPLPGPPFSPFGWPGSRKARLHELLSAWRMFQTGSSEDVNVAPLRMSNNLRCGYWSAVSPCVSSTQVGGPPRQQKQRSSATLPRKKTPRTLCGNPLLLLPVGPECSKDLGPLVARGAGWPGAPRAGTAAATAGPPPPLVCGRRCCGGRCRGPVPARGNRCCRCPPPPLVCGPRGVLRTAVARRHRAPWAQGRVSGAWSAGARTRAGTESGQLRHRHPHTSPDGKRRRGCLERRCGKGGCLAGPASEAGWSCPALPELLAHRKRQRRQRVSTACSCVFVCGEVSGDPLLALPGSASVPCARVLAKSEEPPPRKKRPRAHDQWRGNPTAKAPAATPTASTAAFPASPAAEGTALASARSPPARSGSKH